MADQPKIVITPNMVEEGVIALSKLGFGSLEDRGMWAAVAAVLHSSLEASTDDYKVIFYDESQVKTEVAN